MDELWRIWHVNEKMLKEIILLLYLFMTPPAWILVYFRSFGVFWIVHSLFCFKFLILTLNPVWSLSDALLFFVGLMVRVIESDLTFSPLNVLFWSWNLLFAYNIVKHSTVRLDNLTVKIIWLIFGFVNQLNQATSHERVWT